MKSFLGRVFAFFMHAVTKEEEEAFKAQILNRFSLPPLNPDSAPKNAKCAH
jgi:hypothetical protein